MVIEQNRIRVPRDARTHANQCKADFSVALSRRLQERNLTRTAYAKKLRRTRSYVSQVLAGDKNLSIETMARLAWAASSRLKVGLEKDVGRGKEEGTNG